MSEKLNYIYIFEEHGELVRTGKALENEVWIDVGNTLGMGYFDHHQGGEEDSAFSAVASHTEYLSNLKSSAGKNMDILIHMHQSPDLDCIASTWFIKKFLELSEDEFEKLKTGTDDFKKLLDYLNAIDSGHGKNTESPTLYALFCNIGEGLDECDDTYRLIVEKGIKLFDHAVNKLMEDPKIDLFSYNFGDDLKDSFADEIALLGDGLYIKEKNSNRISFENIAVRTKDNGIDYVPSAIWKGLSASTNGYNYARKEGNVFTLVPISIKDGKGRFTRVVGAINPDIEGYEKYTLRPIAEILEQMEQIEEKKLYLSEGRLRRDYSKPRGSGDNFGTKPFSATSDPWYISELGDMLDAPGAHSLLDYETIVEVIRNNGSNVKRAFGIRYFWSGSERQTFADISKTNIPIGSLVDIVESSEADNRIIFAELDPSLIRHNNEMLKAICMNMAGGTYLECRDEEFLFLDYRTCVYADLNHVIVLKVTDPAKEKDDADKKYLSFEGMESFTNSQFVADVLNALDLRNKMLDISRRTGDMTITDRKKIEKLNRDMLELSVEHQRALVKDGYAEKEVYAFLNEKYGLTDLRASVMEEVSVLVGESRDKLVSRFNTLSAFAVPFILIATVFQMGVIRMEEIVSIEGPAASAGWGIVVILIGLLIYILGRPGK